MGKVLSAYLMPHPPIIVPEVGRGEEKKIQITIDKLNEIARQIKELKPDTIIIISPHGYVFRDAVSVDAQLHLRGDLGQFMAPGVELEFESDQDLIQLILKEADGKGIPNVKIDSHALKRYSLSPELDHGTIVPLYFVTQHYRGFKLIRMSYGFLPFEQLYEFGIAIQKAVEKSDRNVIFIASGDLSHVLTPDSPNGYSPKGEVFDKTLLDMLGKMDVVGIINMDKQLIHEAAECGYRSLCVMLGVLDGYEVDARVLSHEGPFGVGYGVAAFLVTGSGKPSLVDELYDIKRSKIKNIRENEDPYVRLARQSLEYYLKNRTPLPIPKDLPEEMLNKRAGVFVSIHKDGDLRGCIGTIYPQRENVALEIIMNAISAGFEDPRFYPVEENELEDLVYSVDVLMPPEKVSSKDELDPKKYGVIVRCGYKSGLLLPDLEGVDTVDQQISIALKKAGIKPYEHYSIERFEVVRHK
ncbi:uncharacterized protein, PH0010 family/AmmeMemoRadiSam system protein A/AmmeMemoRadiSam system protein B [Caldanaerobius fijiensis DSM 17918]|uniref:Uncharacterized protein, PH0010 family/AmmeMemoRadiSam system protein A/AmmeMemoRadiSam system protein B n=1 Tax=Caldanaerobius fijiensis DSM 17918 TaxID=1121256 RepID=A0A1M4VP22_9THEO|nr:AmmeMemoRadiSam system protein A [Caldanaerobius fijiensis]SHE70583.1 uncharacterized protein, PH0010 family/AmmeMemoRadiSam system protein A/AmmeMemoRadiSam system protein B [Caldanaerobius fijiensis DSM 17918]